VFTEFFIDADAILALSSSFFCFALSRLRSFFLCDFDFSVAAPPPPFSPPFPAVAGFGFGIVFTPFAVGFATLSTAASISFTIASSTLDGFAIGVPGASPPFPRLPPPPAFGLRLTSSKSLPAASFAPFAAAAPSGAFVALDDLPNIASASTTSAPAAGLELKHPIARVRRGRAIQRSTRASPRRARSRVPRRVARAFSDASDRSRASRDVETSRCGGANRRMREEGKQIFRRRVGAVESSRIGRFDAPTREET